MCERIDRILNKIKQDDPDFNLSPNDFIIRNYKVLLMIRKFREDQHKERIIRWIVHQRNESLMMIR